MPVVPTTLATAIEYGLRKRDAPRIGGSTGGFIGLVVGLVVIILGSCVAIYILLRDHSPSDRQRAARRQESHYTSAPAKSGALLPWSAKLGGLFGRTSSDGAPRSKGGHGWIQASGDAWEADEADRTREMSETAVDPPFRPPPVPSYTYSTSTESVSFDPPPESAHYTPLPASHSTLGSLPRSASPESTVSPRQSGPDKNRHFSIDSLASIRTFEGGTKFIEGV
ncbi:hypothetical protein FB451DRAFT_1256525 [Mycena latifolia]|nr:hypothetical protein FB451DRAFT_1256525 [Mycena latifolia]